MAGVTPSAAEMIPQLEAARRLALGDAQVYNQVLPGILPIISTSAPPGGAEMGRRFPRRSLRQPFTTKHSKGTFIVGCLANPAVNIGHTRRRCRGHEERSPSCCKSISLGLQKSVRVLDM